MNKKPLFGVFDKVILWSAIFVVGIATLTSCSSVKGVFGKSSEKEAKQSEKIGRVERDINKNTETKIDQIATLASGTDYALNKVTIREPSVMVATDINKRVMSLSGKPDFNSEKEMWKMVDDLISENSALRINGMKQLQKKDAEIKAIQNESKTLASIKDDEISAYMQLSKNSAMLADTRKMELEEYKGWFGLKAVGKGALQFVTSMAWILGGLGILFMILRFASASSPIAAAVFSIFEQMVSWVIRTVNVVFPKALAFAGHVTKESYNQLSGLFKKVVDNLQNLKDMQSKLGHDITLKELFVELDKSMDVKEKEMVDKIKKELGY